MGGSTIESILEREFAHRFATLHDANKSANLDGTHLESFLRQNPNIVAVSSHHLRYPKPAIRHTRVLDCCFLRHPLDRLDSLYRYLQKIESVDPLCDRARRMSSRDFLRGLVNECPYMVNDVQVTLLAGTGAFTRPAHPEDLEKASAIFTDMAIPGLVEMFDESLAAAEYFLKSAFSSVKLHYVAKNVSRPNGPTVPAHSRDRQDRLVDLWGGELYEDLLRLNKLDLELFRRAEREITRRIGLVPQYEGRLAEFRMRCSQLRGETAYLVDPGRRFSQAIGQ